MRNAKTIPFGESGEVTVKELTPAQLDELLAPSDEYVPTWLDRILDKDNLTGDLLAESSGVSVLQLSEIKPSSLRPLIAAFKEVNPDFFETARLEKERAEEIRRQFAKT